MPNAPVNEHTQRDFREELRIWAKKNNVRPVQLHRETGWTYQYCNDLLNGKRKFGHTSFGLFRLVYGASALEDIIRMADKRSGHAGT